MTYFLVFQERVIEFEDRMVIARKDGNVILEFDKQAGLLQCSIEDKSNSNSGEVRDVTINSINLGYDQKFPFEVGEVLKVNGEDYKLFDSFVEAEKVIPKWNRRRNKRPKNAYAPINFINFYCAPKWALALYFCALLFALSKFLQGTHIEAPEQFKFLAEAYNQNILVSNITLIGLTYVMSILHSFLMYLYFNRNSIRRSFISAAFLVSTGIAIHFLSAPMREIHTYLTIREKVQVLKHDPQEKIINYRKSLIENKTSLLNAYEAIGPGLSADEIKILKDDLDLNLIKIDNELKK